MFAYTSNALVPVAVVVIVLILPVLLGQEKSGALLHTKDNRLFNHILHHNIFKLITINIGFPTDSTSRKISLLHENATPQIQADFFTLQPKPCVVKSGQKAGFNICFQFDGSSYQTQWQYKPQSSQPWIPLPSSSPTSTCLVFTAHSQQDGWLFRCVVSRYPDGPTYISDEALLTVFSS